jgi:hypothetical protein
MHKMKVTVQLLPLSANLKAKETILINGWSGIRKLTKPLPMLNTANEWCNDRISPEANCPNQLSYAYTNVSICDMLMMVGGLQSTSATSSAPFDVSGVVLYCNTRQRHRSRLPCRGHKHSANRSVT